MELLEQAELTLQDAQDELADAEMAFMEATARVEKSREGTERLVSDVAGLKGVNPVGMVTVPVEEYIATENPATSPERAAAAKQTPEEFDAARRRKKRAREKEEQANNPLAHIKCSGCGKVGSTVETIIEAPSGAPTRMMICNKCGNQSF